METYKLNNGVEMPKIGFGTFQIPPEDTERCVTEALKSGYRCIDTAAAYYNEEGVGKAIKASGIDRKDLFIITKLWIQDQGYENAKKGFETSLKKLQLDYIDLYLIHQPFGDVYGSWRAMEELLKEGKVRAIGVCNFSADRLVDLILHNEIVPAVNQIEIHPFFQREDDLKLLESYKIQPQAWGPFAEGKKGIFTNKIIAKIAKAHNKSNAQVILRWELQRDIQIIPKSVKRERMEENFKVFDFELTEEEMNEISKLDTNESLFINHRSVDSVKMLSSWKIHDDEKEEPKGKYQLVKVINEGSHYVYTFKNTDKPDELINKSSSEEISGEFKEAIQHFLSTVTVK